MEALYQLSYAPEGVHLDFATPQRAHREGNSRSGPGRVNFRGKGGWSAAPRRFFPAFRRWRPYARPSTRSTAPTTRSATIRSIRHRSG